MRAGQNSSLPEERRPLLRRALDCGAVRLIEAHNGLSAIVGSEALVSVDETPRYFDGLWLSSFTGNAAQGLPDIELAYSRRLEMISEILAVSTKPVVFDGDTGGDSGTFEYLCRELERKGVSAVVIEDKQHPKRNSLSRGVHLLETPSIFAEKLCRGKSSTHSGDFMVIARIESLIAGENVSEALQRADCYLNSGADGILIHSKDESARNLFDFFDGYRELQHRLGLHRPLGCIPTTYNHIHSDQLIARGAKIVIYANHLLRASCRAMEDTCRMILREDRSLEVEKLCVPMANIFALTGLD